MRCLNCRQNGLPTSAEKCPHCGAITKFLLRDMLPSGTLLHNRRYCIDYPLGRGGFGITYRAFDNNFKMVVVIKEFFPQEHAMRKGPGGYVDVPTTQHGSYEKALHHFLEEARILAKITRENVVRVFDYFKYHNTAYIVMEMVEGHTLRELLDQQLNRCFPPAEVEKITAQMVTALDAIHRHGVFHLDISPDNVLQNKEGNIVLIDFGAARQSLRTNESYSSGTAHQYKLAYAAPEILAGVRVGPKSDLFELAMMTYELLSGTRPPSVLQRAATADKWQPQLADERWRDVLAAALRLEQETRPGSVLDWWNLYLNWRGDRNKIVLGPKADKSKIVIGRRGDNRRR
ncbi:MAG: serine/threonine-protein kinase [Pyrinomonadaceae bacterium]